MNNVVFVVDVVGKIGGPVKKKIKIMEPIIDKYGIEYFDKLPESARLASIEDFYDKYNQLKIGKWYLVESYDGLFYFIKQVHQFLTREKLDLYISTKQLFVSTKEDKN